ncbi:MAG TPA: hypothetical protein VLE02_05185 [Nitrosarchaeum sp.]|nr:hypothetical protein [Nitrosarchaeum sp.]
MFGDRIIKKCLKCGELITYVPCAVCGYDPRISSQNNLKVNEK